MNCLKLTLLFILVTFFASAQYTVTKRKLRAYSSADYRILLLNQDYKKIKETVNTPMVLRGGFKDRHKLHFSGDKYVKLQIGETGQSTVLYLLRDRGELDIPLLKENDKQLIEFKEEQIEIQVSKVKADDLLEYRNLALNPYDWQTEAVSFFPHIETNSECRGDYQFGARNAINGLTDNLGHAKWEHRSWGPEKIMDPWIEIDFGRMVSVDKLVLYLRADFPHDGYWQSATIAFDDGSEEQIELKKTAEAQIFQFSSRKIKSLKIKDLKQTEPLQWCALTEIEVWGREAFPFELQNSWEATLRTLNWTEGMQADNDFYWRFLREKFPVECDWLMQDIDADLVGFARDVSLGKGWRTITLKAISTIVDEGLRSQLLARSQKDQVDLIQLYLEAHELSRKAFLFHLEKNGSAYVFVKRYRFTPSFFAYTEGLSDARDEHSFTPGSALCKATIHKGQVEIETLLEDKNGVIRDPDVSYDGKRILFAWKKSYDKDDYHLYELNTENGSITQLTFGQYTADFEGKYLPNGDIIFNSSRCEQSVDCWKTDVSNLYVMKNDGRFMRRVGFDQVQTPYPTVMDNGKIVYTRWDYNDRGQTFPQPLFTMNPDGTAQTEYYGNNSWYPTTITHARQIPGTNKVMATFCGHHTWQHGKMGIVDPAKGRQENEGTQLIAPVREEEAVRIDQYGQKGIQFQYPYPFSEEYFLVSSDPLNSYPRTPFFLYFMDADGRREVLAWDEDMDCKQAVPLASRERGLIKPSRVDYSKDKGYYYVQNVYHGPGAKGIEKGSIEKLRVVEIQFRAAPVRRNYGSNDEEGIHVGNWSSTPVALGQGAWDVKRILGEVNVEADGSAMFEVPARTPVYFQMIDTAGYVAQTMRSWSTLQPGETFSCIGCHEDKNESVPMMNKSLAMAKGVQVLQPFYGIKEGFSFRKHVQPILNKHCISCHSNRHVPMLNDGKNSITDLIETNAENKGEAFSLLDKPVESFEAGRQWNDAYLNLLQAYYDPQIEKQRRTFKGSFKSGIVSWPGMQSIPTLLPPYYRGAATSHLMKMLKEGHGKTSLSKEEMDIIACWIDLQVPYCGDYKEANIWTEEEMEYYDYYLNKRLKNAKEEAENIKALLEYLNPN